MMLMLRGCENGLSVETTAWEGWKAKQQQQQVEEANGHVS
jgi:inner membrane protease subunit SOM1